jgi:hypothetical protein
VLKALLDDASAWTIVQAPRVREVTPRMFELPQAFAVGE